jgi:hypothetical protein
MGRRRVHVPKAVSKFLQPLGGKYYTTTQSGSERRSKHQQSPVSEEHLKEVKRKANLTAALAESKKNTGQLSSAQSGGRQQLTGL